MDQLSTLAEYLQKIPPAFLVAVSTVLGLILFLPQKTANILAIDLFRDEYRVFLGPTFLFTIAFGAARGFSSFHTWYQQKQQLKEMVKLLHHLTPEEKGYLICFIEGQKNSIKVGMDDGVMAGLCHKNITYRATNVGDMLDGFAFNLQPWAREYLENNSELLVGHIGKPLTPRQILYSEW